MTKADFISDLSHWNSYLPLLYRAMENTSGDIIELGCGDGSTEKMHRYCEQKERTLYSYESNKEWYHKFEHFRTARHSVEWVGHNWEIMIGAHREPIGVLFSDEAPGHMRKYNVSMFSALAQVIVAHDAEESNDHGYKFSWVKPLFKYYKIDEFKGASTAAFSNFVDVSKWQL